MKRYFLVLLLALIILMSGLLAYFSSQPKKNTNNNDANSTSSSQKTFLTASVQETRLVEQGSDRLLILTIRLAADSLCHNLQYQKNCSFNLSDFTLSNTQGMIIDPGPAPTFYIPDFRMRAMPTNYTLPAKTSMTGQLYIYLPNQETDFTLTFINNSTPQKFPIHI